MKGPNSPGKRNVHRVVIVGGGFGGLYAAKALRGAEAEVTLVDKRNFHLFQPLLYQVATGALSSGDIAYPLREVFKRDSNFYVISGEVVAVDPGRKRVLLGDGEGLSYDTLIVATGSGHHYFGHEEWGEKAPGLKTLEDALLIRRKIFLALEAAERERDVEKLSAWMNFVIVGGGPTGVELAGSLADLFSNTLKHNFRRIDPAECNIILLEALDRILPTYAPNLSAKAAAALTRLGVAIRVRTLVTEINDGGLAVRSGEESEEIRAKTVLWSAGVKASALGQSLAERTGSELDRLGRIKVNQDFSLPGHPAIFVIGDLADFSQPDGTSLAGTASVAIQEGRYLGRLIRRRIKGRETRPFRFRDKGNLSVIGRSSAVAQFGRVRFNGFLAWLMWALVHIYYLIGFANKLFVLLEWSWNYLTRRRGARLIMGENPSPRLED